jgi:hypothetical protein
MFITRLESFKKDLQFLVNDKFPSSYKRVEQPRAAGLLEEIELLEHENAEMKEKLSKIIEVLK